MTKPRGSSSSGWILRGRLRRNFNGAFDGIISTRAPTSAHDSRKRTLTQGPATGECACRLALPGSSRAAIDRRMLKRLHDFSSLYTDGIARACKPQQNCKRNTAKSLLKKQPTWPCSARSRRFSCCRSRSGWIQPQYAALGRCDAAVANRCRPDQQPRRSRQLPGPLWEWPRRRSQR